jgi:hypothetical protein
MPSSKYAAYEAARPYFELVRGALDDLVDGEVTGELSHQIGTPPDNARPAREVVEHLVDDVIRDDIEKVTAASPDSPLPASRIRFTTATTLSSRLQTS